MRVLGAGDDEQAGGVAIEAVDDPRPLVVTAGRVELEQPVDERPGRIARPRVNDEAGRLVDDEEVLVLPDDVEIHRLGRRASTASGSSTTTSSPPSSLWLFGAPLAVDEH